MDKGNKQLSIERGVYEEILRQAVAVIERARLTIAKHVNTNVASAYWEIGKMLHEQKIESGFGDGVVKQLSIDLKERYPKMGLSVRQLWNMKKFYLRYVGHGEKLLQAVAVLPWEKDVDDVVTWYVLENKAKGWNRDSSLMPSSKKCLSCRLFLYMKTTSDTHCHVAS